MIGYLPLTSYALKKKTFAWMNFSYHLSTVLLVLPPLFGLMYGFTLTAVGMKSSPNVCTMADIPTLLRQCPDR